MPQAQPSAAVLQAIASAAAARRRRMFASLGSRASATSSASPRWSGEPSARSWSFTCSRRQQQLAARRQFHIMRECADIPAPAAHSLEHRRGNLSALVQSDRRIQNHRHRDRGIIDGRESGKRSHVLGVRIGVGRGINFLRRAGLARGAVAFENGSLARCRAAPPSASSASSPLP